MKGLAVAYIANDTNEHIKSGVYAGQYQLVFITPELLIENKRWRGTLTSSKYAERLRAFVIDEAHCIAKW